MKKLDEKEGIAFAVTKLQKVFGISDSDMMELMGDEVFTAIMQNNYSFITIGDMLKLADGLGLVFVMNFQSLDQYLDQGSEERES